jgi:hypothetical protein
MLRGETGLMAASCKTTKKHGLSLRASGGYDDRVVYIAAAKSLLPELPVPDRDDLAVRTVGDAPLLIGEVSGVAARCSGNGNRQHQR